jgi:hypothetical protein
MDMVDFQWRKCVAGYRLEPTKRGDFALSSASDWFETTHPLKIETLFAIFAKTPATPEGIKTFCDNYGLLGGGRPDIAPPRGTTTYEGALVSSFLQEHRRFRRAFDLFEKGDNSVLAKRWNSMDGAPLIRTELRVGPEGRLQMVFVPPALLQALWLQFALHACSDAKLFRCERCNDLFVVGSGTGRRSTSKWCSNACKVAAFKERQARP